MLVSAIALLLTSAATTAVSAADVTEPDPKAMKQSEIREFNAKLAKNHPYYIRCVREAETGSFVPRKASCRTNQQWNAAHEAGNREARDIQDEMKSKAMNGSN